MYHYKGIRCKREPVEYFMRFNAYCGRPSNVNKTPFKEYYILRTCTLNFLLGRPVFESTVCICHHKTIANAQGR